MTSKNPKLKIDEVKSSRRIPHRKIGCEEILCAAPTVNKPVTRRGGDQSRPRHATRA